MHWQSRDLSPFVIQEQGENKFKKKKKKRKKERKDRKEIQEGTPYAADSVQIVDQTESVCLAMLSFTHVILCSLMY